eukprot:TRINITY_DN2541_c0_g1_i2.p1 TRINITY_DN2541_c0_g1~~TRINITY_DN2541_c0_g1_i2.p1  ORF type:complete len:223 (+),score=32.49 TRINITY_DN2541_c0_g1_i2:74-742(+)
MNQHQLFAPSAPVFDLSAWSDEARLQEQQKRDEALARLLDRSESQEREKASIQEEQDARLALQLLVEEKNRLDREKELELVSEKVAQQLQLDLALAQRWQEDERRNNRPETDAELARRLAEEERIRQVTLNTNNVGRLNAARQHVIAIHKKHCYCLNTGTHNNNHLFQVHNQHCAKPSCIGRQVLGGRLPCTGPHVHDYRCCTVNHLHTVHCPCVFRIHGYK